MVPLGAMQTVIRSTQGHVKWRLSLPMAIGYMLTMLVAAQYTPQMDNETLRYAFGYILAAYVVLSHFWRPGIRLQKSHWPQKLKK